MTTASVKERCVGSVVTVETMLGCVCMCVDACVYESGCVCACACVRVCVCVNVKTTPYSCDDW